jgi:multidrug efflux system membrane fusion protein
MNNHIIRSLIGLLLIAVAISCSPQNEEGQATSEAPKARKQVKATPVIPLNYQEKVYATGKLALEEEAKLSFKTGGIIAKIYVSEGQSVPKGKLLAELDLQEMNARNQQARIGTQQAAINIDNAKLALRLAQRDYDNAKGLYQDSVATLEQLENAEVQLDNANNQLEAAQKAYALQSESLVVADFNLQYSRIVAPEAGIILKKMASANELVTPGKAVFLFGSREKSKVLRTSLVDKDIIHIKLGNTANIQFDAYPNTTFNGVVTEVASLADPFTGTYEIEIQLNAQDKKLLSGFIGSAEIITSTTADLFRIPIDALIGADGNKGEVFVVEHEKAAKTDVQIFKMQEDYLLIEKGLDSTDKVITSGVGYIEDQEPIFISQK